MSVRTCEPGRVTAPSLRVYVSQAQTVTSHGEQNRRQRMRLRDAFHAHVRSIKSAPRVTPPCVFAEPRGIAKFGSETVALFPEVCSDISRLAAGRPLTEPSRGLHTICSTFHQIGIRSFFCSLQIADASDPASFRWQALRLGTPADEAWQPLDAALTPYLQARTRAYNYLRYNTDTSRIPDSCITEEFLKEHLRVSVCTPFTAEVSDVDGILWGNERTYPLEIKEKTAAFDNKLGEYFGIDVGPFVKLAFYAAKRGNLHSLFVVREITDTETRALKQWWFIPFDRLASYASWNQQGGGTNMLGGSSTVVRIPKSQFSILSRDALNQL